MALKSLSPKATSENGLVVEIRHPKTNLPLGITFTVYGSDSDTVKKIQRKQLNRRLERQARIRNSKQFITAEELEAEAMDMIVACTKSWHTGDRPELEMDEGEWLSCTPENVKRIYEALPWLKEQIDQEIGDRTSFLPD